MKKYIVNHLGLGDQLIICGMVRHYIESGYTVKICARLSHKETCEFMYRDTNKVEFDFVDTAEPREIHSRVKKAVQDGYEYVPLASYKISNEMWIWFTLGQGKEMTNWTHATYIQGGVNPSYMLTKFKVDRDLEREQKVFEKFNLKKNEYIFVHESKSRERTIKYPTDLPIFNPDEHYKEVPNIFDYLTIIENAKQVYCMTSSYSWVVELNKLGDKTKNFLYTLDIPDYYTIRESYLTYTDKIWTFI
jgi:hypothetical protein